MTHAKAKVEQGVLLVQRWILAALRKRQFFSLAEVNEAIGELLGKLNQRPFRKLAGSRLELYRQLDRPALQSLPQQPYVSPSGRKSASGWITTWRWTAIITRSPINWRSSR